MSLLQDAVSDKLKEFRLRQKRRAKERKLAGEADLQYIKKIESAKVQNIKRNVRSEVPSNTKTWIIDNFGVDGLKNYNRWLKKGNKELNIERGEVGKELPRKIAAAVVHTTSLAGDPSKQDLKPNPLVDSYKDPKTGEYKPVTQRGADDPTAKFIGSSYRNLHQNKYDAYTKQQIDELGIPDNWAKSAAYFFATEGKGVDKLSHNDWMALQSGEISAEELASGKRVTETDVAGKIKEIHKVEEGVSIKNRWDPESTHYKKLSPTQRQIVELGYVSPEQMVTTKLLSEASGNVLENDAKANILAKNPLIPNLKNVKGPDGYFNKIKNHLTSKGFQREAARLAGGSPNPLANIAGDFVGTLYDGAAVAANPKDTKAIIELAMSGTQLVTSTVGGTLIAIPDPLTSGLGYVIMRAGDRVGQLERLWNMSREGINRKKPEIISKQSGQEIADIKKDFQFDTKSKNLSNLKIK